MPPDPTLNYGTLRTETRGNVDRTIASLSGASQSLLAASPFGYRKRIILKNGAAAAAVHMNGGTAAIGAAGCMTLQPYEGVTLTGKDCPKGAITVIGTSTNYFSCFEGF